MIIVFNNNYIDITSFYNIMNGCDFLIIKYDIIKFNKNDIIIKSGEQPSEYFYILMSGKAVSYYEFYKEYKMKIGKEVYSD